MITLNFYKMLTLFKPLPKTVTVMNEKELRQDNWRLKGIIDKQAEKIKHLESLSVSRTDKNIKAELARIKQLYGTLLHSYNKLRAKQGLETRTYNPSSPDEIVMEVCKYYGITVTQLLGRSRKKEIKDPRHVASYILCKCGYSLKAVGKILGNRDHTTIINSRDRVIYDLENMPEGDRNFINSFL